MRQLGPNYRGLICLYSTNYWDLLSTAQQSPLVLLELVAFLEVQSYQQA